MGGISGDEEDEDAMAMARQEREWAQAVGGRR